MTEQTTPQAPAQQPEQEDVLARLERIQRESRERVAQIERAFRSPEAEKIRELVRDDGNVEWLEFVKHCGGILKVVEMVDAYGLPDTDRIIPKIDELFNKWAQAEVDRGSVFRRRPANRPYVPGPGTSAGEAKAAAKRSIRPGDPYPGEPTQAGAEDVLRALEERPKRLTHPR
jgi:hypothetical protein